MCAKTHTCAKVVTQEFSRKLRKSAVFGQGGGGRPKTPLQGGVKNGDFFWHFSQTGQNPKKSIFSMSKGSSAGARFEKTRKNGGSKNGIFQKCYNVKSHLPPEKNVPGTLFFFKPPPQRRFGGVKKIDPGCIV